MALFQQPMDTGSLINIPTQTGFGGLEHWKDALGPVTPMYTLSETTGVLPFETLREVFSNARAVQVETRISIEVSSLQSWHMLVCPLTKVNNPSPLQFNRVQFIPQMPQRRAALTTAPRVGFRRESKQTKMIQVHMGCAFEWQRIVFTPDGPQYFRAGVTTVSASFVGYIKLQVHHAMQAARAARETYINSAGRSYHSAEVWMNASKNYEFCQINRREKAVYQLCRTVEQIMFHTSGYNYTMIIVPPGTKDQLAYGGNWMTEYFRSGPDSQAIINRGPDVIGFIHQRPVFEEMPIKLEGRNENIHEPMVATVMAGLFNIGTNDCLDNWSSTSIASDGYAPMPGESRAGPGGNGSFRSIYSAADGRSGYMRGTLYDRRVIRCLNPHKGNMEWQDISLSDQIKYAMCWDPTKAHRPLRPEFKILAQTYQVLAHNLGMYLDKTASGDPMVDPFIFFDVNHVTAHVADFWGQVDSAYITPEDEMVMIKIAVSRFREILNNGDVFSNIHEMLEMSNSAFIKPRLGLPIYNQVENAQSHVLEAFALALGAHYTNWDNNIPNRPSVRPNRYGVANLPLVVPAKVDGEFVNDPQLESYWQTVPPDWVEEMMICTQRGPTAPIELIDVAPRPAGNAGLYNPATVCDKYRLTPISGKRIANRGGNRPQGQFDYVDYIKQFTALHRANFLYNLMRQWTVLDQAGIDLRFPMTGATTVGGVALDASITALFGTASADRVGNYGFILYNTFVKGLPAARDLEEAISLSAQDLGLTAANAAIFARYFMERLDHGAIPLREELDVIFNAQRQLEYRDSNISGPMLTHIGANPVNVGNNAATTTGKLFEVLAFNGIFDLGSAVFYLNHERLLPVGSVLRAGITTSLATRVINGPRPIGVAGAPLADAITVDGIDLESPVGTYLVSDLATKLGAAINDPATWEAQLTAALTYLENQIGAVVTSPQTRFRLGGVSSQNGAKPTFNAPRLDTTIPYGYSTLNHLMYLANGSEDGSIPHCWLTYKKFKKMCKKLRVCLKSFSQFARQIINVFGSSPNRDTTNPQALESAMQNIFTDPNMAPSFVRLPTNGQANNEVNIINQMSAIYQYGLEKEYKTPLMAELRLYSWDGYAGTWPSLLTDTGNIGVYGGAAAGYAALGNPNVPQLGGRLLSAAAIANLPVEFAAGQPRNTALSLFITNFAAKMPQELSRDIENGWVRFAQHFTTFQNNEMIHTDNHSGIFVKGETFDDFMNRLFGTGGGTTDLGNPAKVHELGNLICNMWNHMISRRGGQAQPITVEKGTEWRLRYEAPVYPADRSSAALAGGMLPGSANQYPISYINTRLAVKKDIFDMPYFAHMSNAAQIRCYVYQSVLRNSDISTGFTAAVGPREGLSQTGDIIPDQKNVDAGYNAIINSFQINPNASASTRLLELTNILRRGTFGNLPSGINHGGYDNVNITGKRGISPAVGQLTDHRAAPLSQTVPTIRPGQASSGLLNEHLLNLALGCKHFAERFNTWTALDDPFERCLGLMFMGTPIYGKRLEQWGRLNFVVPMSFLPTNPFVEMKTNMGYFANPGIGQIPYLFDNSVVGFDTQIQWFHVDVSAVIGGYVVDDDRLFIAPSISFRQYVGGWRVGTYNTRFSPVEIRNNVGTNTGAMVAGTEFHASNVKKRVHDGFMLYGPGSMRRKDLSPIITLSPRPEYNGPMRRFYGTSNPSELVDSMARPTHYCVLMFCLLTGMGKNNHANRPFQAAQTYSQSMTSSILNDICCQAPQRNWDDSLMTEGFGWCRGFRAGMLNILMGGIGLIETSTHVANIGIAA